MRAERRTLPRAPRRPWASVIRASAFVRKELAEILRQPGLIALLVLGPFLLLLLFGLGYSQEPMTLRATFVGPAGSVYEESLETYRDQLDDFVDSQGYTDDEAAARRDLEDGDTDLVVVFPADAFDTVEAGERAVITIVHDEIDPIRQVAIEVAARLAIQEVNAAVVSSVAGAAQESAQPLVDAVAELGDLAGQLEAASDATSARPTLAAVDEALGRIGPLLGGADQVLTRLPSSVAPDGDATSALADLRERVQAAEAGSDADVASLAADLRTLADRVESVSTIPPEVLSRPFDSRTETVLPERIDPKGFFGPTSIALLLQHLALTLAALSLMRDKRTGLFEVLRVGPLSSGEILVGKFLAHIAVGSVVAAALIAAAVGLLDVPLEGDPVWLVPAVLGVVAASLGMGMLVSSLSKTESQAVQWAMLVLLAAMFFGGFVLSLEDLAYPVKLISWALPVTYGIRTFQTVMLRGQEPAAVDLLGLAGTTCAYVLLAVIALRRELRNV